LILSGESPAGDVRIGAVTVDGDLFRRATEAWSAGTAEQLLPEIEAALPRSVDYRLWHIHGLILRQLERREEALVSLHRAVALKPDAVKPVHALARTLYEAGLPSIDAYGQALRLTPGNEEVLGDLTMAFVGAGEVKTAINGLEQIVARSPTWLAGHTKLSQLRWMEGERDGFTRSFSEALAQYPGAIDLWRGQIVALMHAEQWDEALDVIAHGRELLGEQPLFAINEAVIHAERGEIALADQLLAPLLGVDDPSLQIRIVRHHLRAGRPEAAGAIIEQWLARPEAFMFYPYVSIVWRLIDPDRWQWLEGDERFVGVYDIADRLPPLDELAATLRDLHKLSGQPLEQSLRGGTQTDGDIFTRLDPVLVQLREAVRTTVAEHVAGLPPVDPGHPLLSAQRDSIRFAGAWSVRLRSAGFHSNHVHPLGWFSSALYVALPPDIGVGEAGMLTLGEPRSSCFDIDMAPFHMITPRPGRLALFPSYMWHGTRPFGDGERLTVAFDVARIS
jgi:Flp pilus assembly protein TadD